MSSFNLMLGLLLAAGSKNQHAGIFVAVFVLMGILLFIFGFKKYGEYRVLKDTPRAKVRSIPMGLVHLEGKAVGEKRLTSPLTHQPCFYYHVQVEKWVQKDKDSEGWQNYSRDYNAAEFWLDDSTGKVRVNPQQAEYDVTKTFQGELWGKQGLMQVRIGKGPKTFVEPSLGVAAPTEDELRAYVLGRSGHITSTLGESSSGAARALGKIVGAAQAISDWETSKDRFRLTEICLLADRACNILGTCTENPSPQDEHDRNVIQKGQNQPTFVIADKAEVRLEKDIFRNAVIMVVLGGVFIVVGAAVALSALHLL
jgi:hypothetical protein